MSTPVKSSDDGVLSQASDQASSRDEKLLPPLPGRLALCQGSPLLFLFSVGFSLSSIGSFAADCSFSAGTGRFEWLLTWFSHELVLFVCLLFATSPSSSGMSCFIKFHVVL